MQYMGKGGTRAVYQVSPTHVIKVPLDSFGESCNRREASIYANPPKYLKDFKFAACHMLEDGILLMEYVTPWFPIQLTRGGNVQLPDKWNMPRGFPQWAQDVDCGQVGWNLAGEIVAFDYEDLLTGLAHRQERESYYQVSQPDTE